ncbi:MAG: zinc-dependent peptidase [Saprospiraceae bacterium]|nr:zinc-dependent peptidase [Saprospiraceae bacterium]
MLSRYLYIPFLLGAVGCLLAAATVDSSYAVYAAPFAVGLAVVYILSPQIDWWWYKRHPLDVAAGLRHFINTTMPFYQNLTAPEKDRFRNRVAMYMEANEYMGQGMEEVPPDVKGVIAACAVQLTFGHEDYLMNKFEHIVVYPHPFPSPQYPDQWHSSEHFAEDGVIMFSAEQLMPGFVQPQRFLNIGLYEYTRVFRYCHPEVVFPEIGEAHWPVLVEISGFPKDKTIQYIGLREIDMVALAVVYFFGFGERFKALLPAEYESLAIALRLGGERRTSEMGTI